VMNGPAKRFASVCGEVLFEFHFTPLNPDRTWRNQVARQSRRKIG